MRFTATLLWRPCTSHGKSTLKAPGECSAFDWLSTQQGNSLQYENLDHLPASLVSSLNTLDRVRGSLWNELLIDGYNGSLNISVSSSEERDSTHLKMKRKNLPFNRICDARAMRIVVGEASTSETGTEREIDGCYELTDLIHKLYRPIEGESTTTSPIRRRPAIALCTPPSTARTGPRSRYRCVRSPCTTPPSSASPHSGCTRVNESLRPNRTKTPRDG